MTVAPPEPDGRPRKGDLAIDPRGLIFEAYRMQIGPEDCRAIFLDWALGLAGPVQAEDVAQLLDHYAPRHPDHPMTAVLRAGLDPAPQRRRSARRARRQEGAVDP